jgi:hypothetical protein
MLRRYSRLHYMLLLAAALLCLAPLTSCEPSNAAATSGDPARQDTQSTQAVTSFVVRFRTPHPLARAQELEAAGRCDEARRLAQETISAQAELAGLCFDRFTLGGAEIVLASCTPVAAADAEAFQRTWVERLAAMDGVEYAEANLVVTGAGCS